MIKSLEIQNFQSHKNTKLVFHPGVNIIVGSSDSGKTAVLRALRWGLTNKPSGDAFRSSWGGTTEVRIELEDAVIERLKGNSSNLYKLNDFDLAAFGQGVPDEVEKAANINDVNLQAQMDAPFLLSENSGEVAKFFNRIARLDVIDKTTSRIKKATNKVKEEINVLTITIEKNEKDLLRYGFIKKAEIDLGVLEGMEQTKSNKVLTQSKLRKLISDINTTENQIIKNSEFKTIEKKVDELLKLIEEKKKLETSYNLLSILISRISEAEKNMSDIKGKVVLLPSINNLIQLYQKKEIVEKNRVSLIELKTRVEKTNKRIKFQKDFLQVEEKMNAVLLLIKDKNEMLWQKSGLLTVVDSIKSSQMQMELKSKELDSLENQFHTLMPNICPLCGSNVKKK